MNFEKMDEVTISDVSIQDVDSEVLRQHNSVICIEQNGFLLCKQGHISLRMDDRLYELQAGDLYVYPAFSQTYVHGFSDDMVGVIGKADFDFVLSSLDSIANTQSYVYIRFHPRLSLNPIQFQCVEKLIEGIRSRMRIHSILQPQIVSSLLQAFCYEVIDAYISNTDGQMTSGKQTRKGKIYQNFIVLLHKNFRLHRDVTFYAGELNITPRYFATVIHEVSGRTPLQWISLFVITEAKHLLSNPHWSVKDVSNALNFVEQSLFRRYFKQYTGYSPSEYKANVSIRKYIL